MFRSRGGKDSCRAGLLWARCGGRRAGRLSALLPRALPLTHGCVKDVSQSWWQRFLPERQRCWQRGARIGEVAAGHLACPAAPSCPCEASLTCTAALACLTKSAGHAESPNGMFRRTRQQARLHRRMLLGPRRGWRERPAGAAPPLRFSGGGFVLAPRRSTCSPRARTCRLRVCRAAALVRRPVLPGCEDGATPRTAAVASERARGQQGSQRRSQLWALCRQPAGASDSPSQAEPVSANSLAAPHVALVHPAAALTRTLRRHIDSYSANPYPPLCVNAAT